MRLMFQRYPALRLLFYIGIPVVGSTLVFARIYQNGLVNLLIDAQSHWLHAFLIVHSITPGVSQIGFWPPLLHVLLLPVVLVLPMPLIKDIGAYFTLLPLLLATAFFMRGMLKNCGASDGMATLGGALLLLHPFMQYFTSSAMAEVPFVFSIAGTAYFASRWHISSTMRDLSMFGVFVSLCVLARYEGAIIMPVSAAFVVFDRLKKRIAFSQWKAEFVIFCFMASVGPMLVLIYSYAYSGTLLGFMSLGSDRVFNITQSTRTPINLQTAREKFDVFYYASVHMHGRVAVKLFPLAVMFMLLRRKWEQLMILAIIIAPSVLIIVRMIRGSNTIVVPGPGDDLTLFANTRYALTWICALVFALVCAIDSIAAKRRIGKFFRAMFAIFLVLLSVTWFVQVFFVEGFSTIRRDETASFPHEEIFFPEYDRGRVLMTRDQNVSQIYYSVIPMSSLIIETNYQRFTQAMKEPWLFARWVVITEQSGRGISKRLRDLMALERQPEFQRYYELVHVTPARRVYRLNDSKLRSTATSMGYNLKKIPSLNPVNAWNPSTVYEEIQGQ